MAVHSRIIYLRFLTGVVEHSGRFSFLLDGRQLLRLVIVAQAEFGHRDVKAVRSYGVGCKSTYHTLHRSLASGRFIACRCQVENF